MTLFGFDPQHREKRAIWRLFELSELRWGMADGRIFRWFAANIPPDNPVRDVISGAKESINRLLAVGTTPAGGGE
jgi:hypothetical protein